MGGSFDTTFIEKHINTLIPQELDFGNLALEKKQEISLVGLLNVWLENKPIKESIKKSDPWLQFDNFRLNHQNFRDVDITDSEGKVSQPLRIEYLSDSKFNVYLKKSEDDFELILKEAEI